MDEAALAHNIIGRPWTRLLGWLDYSQVAPPGFLLLEKAVVSAFNSSEFSLRLVPLFCALASVWLSWLVCRRLFTPLPAMLPFGLFALTTSLADAPMRAKPYEGDIAASLLIVLMALMLFDRPLRLSRAIGLSLVSSLTVLFSFPSILVLAGASLAALNNARRDAARRRELLAAAAVWIVAAGLGVLVATRSLSPADAAYMRWFWKPAFMPLGPTPITSLMWLGHQLKATFRWTLDYRASAIWSLAAAAGVWSLLRRKQDAALLLILPVVLAVVASAAQRYPFFSGRTQLYLIPALLILAGEGAYWSQRALLDGFSHPCSGRPSGRPSDRLKPVVYTHVKTALAHAKWIAAVPYLLLIGLGVQATWHAWGFQGNSDLRGVFHYVRDHWRPGDRLYVHFATAQVFMYYAPQLGFTPGEYILGTCSETDESMLRQVDVLRDNPRVWMAICCTDESEPVYKYLGSLGRIRDTFAVEGRLAGESALLRGAAILYDLSAADAGAITPSTFPLPPYSPPAGVPPCYGLFTGPALSESGSR